jgi:hypothetical protein
LILSDDFGLVQQVSVVFSFVAVVPGAEYAKMSVRLPTLKINYATLDGSRQSSATFNIALFPPH